ncbi:MAG: Aspartate--ammonia ligase, partial [Gemmatimonadetes bacterium]|nr:Aspartate--ammonia ligase [Gemmatimonadota bacterium]
MNGFICLHTPGGQFVTEPERARYVLRAPDGTAARVQWLNEPGISIGVVSDRVGLCPVVSRRGSLLGVGVARLDNRAELRGLSGARPGTDVDLLLDVLASQGDGCMARVSGDYSVVVWDATSRRLRATRDPLGGKNLYYAHQGGIIALCSRSSPLADGDRYDSEFIASYLAAGGSSPNVTVFAGVHAVPAGTMMTWAHGALNTARFWNARDFDIDDRLVGDEPCDMFRALFSDAVRLRLGEGNETWAQLSGGLDSSSIVSMAQSLSATNRSASALGGTITFADSLAGAHELTYSNAVVARHGVRNETIVDYWPWQDDGIMPPLTDRPVPLYPFYAQTRRMNTVIRRAGGRVLLSGHGSDFYLTGNLFFFADLIARGHLWTACQEMAQWAVQGRMSFWGVALDNAVVPLLPRSVRRYLQRGQMLVPSWIDDRFARQAGIDRHSVVARQLDAPAGQQYSGAIAYAMDALGAGTDHEVVSDAVDVRYPFLYRPLVEFALRLPPVMRTRPHARKWILREAMRGL